MECHKGFERCSSDVWGRLDCPNHCCLFIREWVPARSNDSVHTKVMLIVCNRLDHGIYIRCFYIAQTLKVWQICLHLPYKNWSTVGKYTRTMECLGFTVLHLAWIRNLTFEIQRSLDFGKLFFRGQKSKVLGAQQKKNVDFFGWRILKMTKTCVENTICFYKEAARTIETTYLRSYGGRLESQWWTLFGCWDLDRFMEGKAEAKNLEVFFFRLKW